MKVDRKRALLWALDFNVDPMCSVVAQVDGEGVLVLDEIVLSRATTHAGVRGVSESVSGAWGGADGLRGCVGARTCRRRGLSDLEILKKFFRSGEYGAVEFRGSEIESGGAGSGAGGERGAGGGGGEATAASHPRCKELIKDLEQVTYKENSQVIDKERDPKRTHLSDALGYLVWQELRVQGEGGGAGERRLI